MCYEMITEEVKKDPFKMFAKLVNLRVFLPVKLIVNIP